MSIEKNIHLVHFGQWPVEPYASWRRALMEMNPSYSFWLWNEGTIHQLGLDFDSLKSRFLTYAGVSNAVRLHALYAKGGHYFDSDCEPVKPLDRLDGFIQGAEQYAPIDSWACEQEPGRWCNASMGAKSGSRWIGAQIEALPSIEKLAAFAAVDLMNRFRDMETATVPHHWFFPWNHDTAVANQHIHNETMLVHRWHGSWLPNKH
jgi:mannosyltransferase OCH1-like enzyme